MEDERSPTTFQTIVNQLSMIQTSRLHSNSSSTPIVRHNFRSIDELLLPIPKFSDRHDDSGYTSQLSISFRSQENDDINEIENLKPTVSSTPCLRKTKNYRTAFTDEQKQGLDRFYSINRYPDSTDMEVLSRLLSLNEKVIRVWFQNKRSRQKHHPN